MIAVTIFVATYFALTPSWKSFIGVVLFLFTYSSVYYYNDLIDYKSDKKRAYMPSEKLLRHEKATEKDYVHLLAWVPVAGLLSTYLYSPLLAVVAALAILVNHARTVVKNLFVREVLLAVVEFLNFEGFWVALYGSLIPGLAVPIFAAYSSAYALSHALYKLRSKPLLWAVRQWWVWVLAGVLFVSAVFSIPLAAESTAHFIALIVFTALYVLAVGVQAARYANNVEAGMEKIFKAHDVALVIGTVMLMLIGAAIVYANIPIEPLPVQPPAQMTVVLSSIDRYQNEILHFML